MTNSYRNTYYLLVIFLFLNSAVIIDSIFANEFQLPYKMKLIEKKDRNYSSPENAYISLYSALIAKDLDWFFESLTNQSAKNFEENFKKANIDPKIVIMRDKPEEESFIIQKIEIKGCTVLVVEHIEQNGSITRNPQTFISENGLWKRTDQLSGDQEYHSLLSFYKRADVNVKTKVNYGGVHYNRRTNQFYFTVSVTNISQEKLEGPVWLKIINIQPVDAVLVSADGNHFGEPFIKLLAEEEKWMPGSALPTQNIYFTNPGRERISFEEEVLAVVPD